MNLKSEERCRDSPISRTSSSSTIVAKEFLSDSLSIRSSNSEEDLRYPCQAQACRPSMIETMLHWTVKILGVTTAILFGVWAPVSYRLQAIGNKSNDDAQGKLLGQVGELARRIENVEELLGDLGRLRAIEFCEVEPRKKLPACISLSSSLHLASILEGLASLDSKHAPSSRRMVSSPSPTTTTFPTSKSLSEPQSVPILTGHPGPLFPSASRIARPSWETPDCHESIETGFPHSPIEPPWPAVAFQEGKSMRIVIMMAFSFGVLLCSGVVGGLKVVARRKVRSGTNRRRAGWRKGGSRCKGSGETLSGY